jgi:hypothetical protein
MPFARLIVAASLLVSCPAVPMTTGTSALPEQDPITFIQYPLVHQVICLEGKGTAFRVGPRHFLSVAHVTGLHGCSVDGQPIAVTEQDKGRDFRSSMRTFPLKGSWRSTAPALSPANGIGQRATLKGLHSRPSSPCMPPLRKTHPASGC